MFGIGYAFIWLFYMSFRYIDDNGKNDKLLIYLMLVHKGLIWRNLQNNIVK